MKRFIMFIAALPILMCLTLSAQAEEKFKDYIFKGLPNYEINHQVRNFDQIKIKSPKPESTDFIETTYEGNHVQTNYSYTGPAEGVPSLLQIFRNYQNAAKKLDGEILYEESNECHLSFKRNDKQYYMTVRVYNSGHLIEVKIVEVAEMVDELEIIDADTIVHKLEKEGHIALYINFDTGLATLKPDADEVIDEIVTALNSKPDLNVKLEGHTDNVGNAAANKTLSNDRANAVMNAIVAKGIDKSRLSAEGFGLEKPVADNNTEEGRAKNRRVELVKQ
jgi:outer membrane protein OmpA-like peptidoglycan-associated protein